MGKCNEKTTYKGVELEKKLPFCLKYVVKQKRKREGVLDMKRMNQVFNQKVSLIPKLFQGVLTLSLVFLGLVLSFLLIKELMELCMLLLTGGEEDYKHLIANILNFFLYFEFITMIVKYFKENYHFPIRYFLYIGITAMVRVIIVDHHNPMNNLILAGVILVLIVAYFILNITPRQRPETVDSFHIKDKS